MGDDRIKRLIEADPRMEQAASEIMDFTVETIRKANALDKLARQGGSEIYDSDDPVLILTFDAQGNATNHFGPTLLEAIEAIPEE